jgi:CubicO group peptidase (beta-lactamase class C family)
MTKSAILLILAMLVACSARPTLDEAASASVQEDDPSPAPACFVAADAGERKRRITQQMLPNVVFDGETTAVDVAARMAEHRVPALSVAVIRGGQIDWTATWGNSRDQTRADCSSLFQAGSLAKPATVMAVLRMAQLGRVDLDADVANYLERYRLPAGRQSATHPVTLRNLLMHTAGITPGGYEGYAQDAPLPDDVQTLRAEPPSNARKVEVLETPGTSLVYSGGGYTVAEVALEDLFDQPFDRLMREWLLDPLRMSAAEFALPLPQDRLDAVAQGHQADGQVVAGGWRLHPEQAAAGLWASATDLARLLVEMHRGWNGRSAVFAEDSLRELMARPFDGHAYGFRLIGEGDQVFLTHNGGTVGYRASMTLNLISGDGAVVLTNSDNGIELARELFASVAREQGWPVFRETHVTRRDQPQEVLAALAGRYAFAEQGWQVSLVFEQGTLTLVFPNGDRYALTPIEGEALEFIHAATGVRASFTGDETRRELLLYGQTGRRVGWD